MATTALIHYTPEEYLALERHAEFKSEYLNGRIIAMTGASPEHADVVEHRERAPWAAPPEGVPRVRQ